MVWGEITSPLLFHVGRQAADALDDATALDRDHLAELSLGALGSATAQVALAALGANKLARPGQAEALGSGLMSLKLELAGFWLARHGNVLLSAKISAGR